jgi:hypothetical protein
MLVALDTNLQPVDPFDSVSMEVGCGQLPVLDTILTNPAGVGKGKMVFFHPHPFTHGNPLCGCEMAES